MNSRVGSRKFGSTPQNVNLSAVHKASWVKPSIHQALWRRIHVLEQAFAFGLQSEEAKLPGD